MRLLLLEGSVVRRSVCRCVGGRLLWQHLHDIQSRRSAGESAPDEIPLFVQLLKSRIGFSTDVRRRRLVMDAVCPHTSSCHRASPSGTRQSSTLVTSPLLLPSGPYTSAALVLVFDRCFPSLLVGDPPENTPRSQMNMQNNKHFFSRICAQHLLSIALPTVSSRSPSFFLTQEYHCFFFCYYCCY